VDVNLWKLLRGGDTKTRLCKMEILLFPAKNTNPADATALADASFSYYNSSWCGRRSEKPGLVNIPPNTPLNQGLLTAGGFNNSRAKGDLFS